MTPRKRLVGIDLVRSLAIIGAMGSHAAVSAGAFQGENSPAMMVVRLLMGFATPVFICLFGTMLEIVYRKKMERTGAVATVQQLLSRALQCYLLYVLAVSVRLLIGDYSLGYAIRCVLLIGGTAFSDILKFYAVVLVLSPFIIRLSQHKLGMPALLAYAIGVHLAFPLLAILPPPPLIDGRDYLYPPAGFVYGGAEGVGGPSVAHGISFVIFGILIGRASRLLTGDSGARQLGRRAFAALVVVPMFVAAALWPWQESVVGTAELLIHMDYRNDNHPIYFALGAAAAALFVWIALELYDLRGVRRGSGLAFIGSVSLFTFAFGNILVVLAPQFNLPGPARALYGGVLLVAVLLLSWTFYTCTTLGRRRLDAGEGGALASWAKLQRLIVNSLSAMMRRPARIYANLLWFPREAPISGLQTTE